MEGAERVPSLEQMPNPYHISSSHAFIPHEFGKRALHDYTYQSAWLRRVIFGVEL